MDLNNNCPACGGKGTIGYHINSYGQVVKQCNNCNYVITDDVLLQLIKQLLQTIISQQRELIHLCQMV